MSLKSWRLVRRGVLPALLLAGMHAVLASPVLEAGPPTTITTAPEPLSPSDGSTVATLGPTLQWSLPAGATQYQLQVTPINNDGPGVNLIVGSAGDSFTVPPPPDWYGLLPDMSYHWRLRAGAETTGMVETDDRWSPWSTAFRFRTPAAVSGTITLTSPVSGAQVASRTPTLTWTNGNPAIYYYEVQVSKDPGFGPNTFLYWELRHGGVTTPANSYTIPSAFPLEAGAAYHWRVRPRIQGDGNPVEWTPSRPFSTASATPPSQPLLQITSPADESSVTTPTVQVTGRTRPGAIVTVNEAFVTADSAGNFRVTVTLLPGPNELEVIATDMQGNTARAAITVTYITP